MQRIAITTFIMLIVSSVLYYWSSMDSGRIIAEVFAIIIMILAAIAAIGIGLVTSFQPIKIPESFESQVNKELNKIFTEYNKKHISKGLYWRVVPNHYWIELRIDKDLPRDLEKFKEVYNHQREIMSSFSERFPPDTAK